MPNPIPVLMNRLTIENGNSFYVLGCWLSDGCIVYNKTNKSDGLKHYECKIGSIDRQWIKCIRDYITPFRKIRSERHRNRNAFYKISMKNKELTKWFFKWGCVPRKSFTVKFPKNVPKKYLPELIRGILDGDGSITVFNHTVIRPYGKYDYKKVNIYICGSSPLFIKYLSDLLNKIDIKNSFFIARKAGYEFSIRGKGSKYTSDHYRLQISNDPSRIKFLNYIYGGSMLRNNRKHKLGMMALSILKKKPGFKYKRNIKPSVSVKVARKPYKLESKDSRQISE